MTVLTLLVGPQGELHSLYDDRLPWREFGPCAIRRASHVEPNTTGEWLADLAPVGGPLLGPFNTRAEALQAEQAYLTEHLAEIPHG